MLHADKVYRRTNTNPKLEHQFHSAYTVYCTFPKWKVCFRQVPPTKEYEVADALRTKDGHFELNYTLSSLESTSYCVKLKHGSLEMHKRPQSILPVSSTKMGHLPVSQDHQADDKLSLYFFSEHKQAIHLLSIIKITID